MLFFMRRRRSFFCVLRKFSADRILSKQHIIRDGGENLENKNYLGLHRVQTEKLQHKVLLLSTENPEKPVIFRLFDVFSDLIYHFSGIFY